MSASKPIALRRSPADVNAWDAEAVRSWLMEQVREEILLKGQPLPKIILLADGFMEILDLTTMVKTDPEASAGATFQALRERPKIERRFLLIQMTGEDHETMAGRRFALLLEEIDDLVETKRKWWVATLEYETDPNSHTGIPAREWQESKGETDNPAHLWPFLHEFVAPPPGSRPAAVLPPRVVAPDMKVAFGEIPQGVEPPANARQMAELVGQVAVNDLLTGTVKGTVVVRLAGRAWEMWVLSGPMPTSPEDMIRYIANKRTPPADGVGLAQVAIRPEDDPPVQGVQVIGELDGMFSEAWAPIEFPGGPPGRSGSPASRGGTRGPCRSGACGSASTRWCCSTSDPSEPRRRALNRSALSGLPPTMCGPR